MMRLLQLPVTLCMLALCVGAHAEIYKVVDKDGKITYSDAPQGEKIDPVDLPKINSQPPTQTSPQDHQTRRAPAAIAYKIQLISPSNELHIPPGTRNLSVSAKVSPPLQGGFKAQLMMNGSKYGSPSTNAQFTVPNISRGEHKVSIAVINPKGKAVAHSKAATVYVIRARAN